ncbi:MAG TPA: YbhB/YbcL family Raf kinase inhibitor-like protein, partial [Ilumatobacteraceae bacterium]|nr:YbhB/YbcL family Raf kinase inhibitor-like protein [Ilumatobacteraceae bacterium]
LVCRRLGRSRRLTAVLAGRPPLSRSALLATSLVMCLAASTALAACNDDGRTLRPARLDQNGSVYTTTTTTTTIETSLDNFGNLDGASANDYDGDSGRDGDSDANGDLDPALTTPTLAFVLNLPWPDGGTIDALYTCAGGNVQPGVSWLGAPAGAVEMALVVTDTDVSTEAGNLVHWVVAGLDPTDPFIGQASLPAGAIVGLNEVDSTAGWAGPCPPAGSSHHYLFSLYALDQQLELASGTPAVDLIAAIELIALSVTHRTGVYPGN